MFSPFCLQVKVLRIFLLCFGAFIHKTFEMSHSYGIQGKEMSHYLDYVALSHREEVNLLVSM